MKRNLSNLVKLGDVFVKKIFNYLYDDASIFLNRKRDKIANLVYSV